MERGNLAKYEKYILRKTYLFINNLGHSASVAGGLASLRNLIPITNALSRQGRCREVCTFLPAGLPRVRMGRCVPAAL